MRHSAAHDKSTTAPCGHPNSSWRGHNKYRRPGLYPRARGNKICPRLVSRGSLQPSHARASYSSPSCRAARNHSRPRASRLYGRFCRSRRIRLDNRESFRAPEAYRRWVGWDDRKSEWVGNYSTKPQNVILSEATLAPHVSAGEDLWQEK